MRRWLLLSLACSGCLISAPEGATQSWPPPLGMTVQAVAAGDLDGNGSTDVVVFGKGTDSQEGMYLLTGGKDLGGGSSRPVKSFSKFVPAQLDAPTAAFVHAGAAPSVYVATRGKAVGSIASDKVDLILYSNILAEKERVETTLPSGGASLWIHPLVFPGNMEHIAVSNGSAIDHVAADFADVKPVPPPSGPSWDLAQLATSFTQGADQIAVAATPTLVTRATLPTTMGAMFQWTTVRMGSAWLGVTAVDLDGDGREEILGLDLAAKQLCVVDPGAVTVPVTPQCLSIPMPPPGTEVTLLVGANITMNAAPDILITQASATDTQFTLVEDYTYASGALVSTSIHGVPVSGPAHGRTVIVNSGPGTPSSVLSFGTDGTVVCVMGPC